MATLYAQTADSAKCVNDQAVSSHLVKSRTIPTASCTPWYHSAGRRMAASS
jgi:hypothetical protein